MGTVSRIDDRVICERRELLMQEFAKEFSLDCREFIILAYDFSHHVFGGFNNIEKRSAQERLKPWLIDAIEESAEEADVSPEESLLCLEHISEKLAMLLAHGTFHWQISNLTQPHESHKAWSKRIRRVSIEADLCFLFVAMFFYPAKDYDRWEASRINYYIRLARSRYLFLAKLDRKTFAADDLIGRDVASSMFKNIVLLAKSTHEMLKKMTP